MPDDCADMDNTNVLPPEPKPQPIFMKMTENFSEIIATLDNSLDCIPKKNNNGGLIQIFPADISQ